MTPETAELVRYRLGRASESVTEAQLLLANDHVRTAVNRLYHACFYAVSALLLTQESHRNRSVADWWQEV